MPLGETRRKCLVKWDTVYRRFRRWVAAGVFDSIIDEIGDELHTLSAIKDAKPPASFDPDPTSSLPLQPPPA